MVKTEQQKKNQVTEKATQSPNARSLCKKKYKGVRMRSWGSWVSEIRAPNQKTRIWLGSYSNPEAAARAYDAALICLKGASANLNFPDTVMSQHFPDTPHMSPKSIQRIAAAAAAAATANGNVFSDASANIPPVSTPSISSVSSPSLSSSPLSDVIEDDVSLEPYSNTYLPTFLDEPLSMAAAPWYNFDSPKYTDMLNGAFFDPLMMIHEDVYEEGGDIRLWSFC